MAGDFNGDGRTDLAVANTAPTTCRCCWATATAPSRTRCVRGGDRAKCPRGGGLQRRRPHRPGRRQLRLQRRVGVAGQRRRHLPGPGDVRGGVRADRPRGGGLQRRRPHRPGRRQRRLRRRVGVAGQRRRHLPGPGAVRGGVPGQTPSWRGTSTATAAPTWPSPTTAPTTCRCCWATATAPSRTRCGTRRGPGQTPSWRGTSTATAAPTWPSPTPAPTTCRCCWATATAPSRTRCRTRRGPGQRALVAGDFNGDGRTDLAVANYGSNDVSVLLGNGDGTFQDQVRYAAGPGQSPSWRGTSTATAAPTWPSPTRLQRRVGVAGQRRRHLPGPGAVRGGDRAIRPRGGGLQRRRPHRPGRRQPRLRRRVGVAGQRRRHLPGPGAVRGGDRARSPSWRGTSTATAAPTWPSPTTAPTTCRCCWATATAPSRTRCGTRRGPGHTPSWRGTSTATAAPTWPSPTKAPTTCRCCWATATAPSRTR